jgi:hypothetical protein
LHVPDTLLPQNLLFPCPQLGKHLPERCTWLSLPWLIHLKLQYPQHCGLNLPFLISLLHFFYTFKSKRIYMSVNWIVVIPQYSWRLVSGSFTDTQILRCPSPFYKMLWYLHRTFAYPRLPILPNIM